MNDPAIERKLNRWMPKIIGGNRRALNSLMRDEWMLRLLNHIAKWAERRKKIAVDEEHGTDIQEIVTARIRNKLHTIKNPNKVPWSKCVAKWSYVLGGKRCEDVRKRNTRVVGDYRRAVEHENTARIEHGMRIIEPASPLPSPEEELERKEEAPLREKVESKIHETVCKARKAATTEQNRILSLWAKGLKLGQIAKEMGISTSNVHRKLTALQQAIVASVLEGIIEEIGEAEATESGVAKVLEEVVEERDDLRELLANSSKEMRGRGRGSRPHV